MVSVQKVVGRNANYFKNFEVWIHKKCSGIKERLVVIGFKCCRWLSLACSIDVRLADHDCLPWKSKTRCPRIVCVLGDGISPSAGCEVSTIARVRSI